MSILAVAIVQAFILGIGFGIGYFFNKTNLKIWRLLSGLLVGFSVSWLVGIFLWVFAIVLQDPNADIPLATIDGISKTFLFAFIGASAGVYYGRKKVKLETSEHAPLYVNTRNPH